MPFLNPLVFTAADYKIFLNYNGTSLPLLTCQDFDYTTDREQETIYAIGEENPIGEKRNSAKFSGKFSLQQGELASLLLINGLVEPTQITGATISIVSFDGLFVRTYLQVNINNESFSVKAKDKQSITTLSWNAIAAK